MHEGFADRNVLGPGRRRLNQPFDVIVTYLRMSEGGGGSTGFIAMTVGDPSVNGAQSIKDARGAGALRVLVEPVTRAQCLQAVNQAIHEAA